MPSHVGTCTSPKITGKVFEGNGFNPVVKVKLLNVGKLEVKSNPIGNIIIGGGEMPWTDCADVVSSILESVAVDEITTDDKFVCMYSPGTEGQTVVQIPSVMGISYPKVHVQDAMGYRAFIIEDSEGNKLCHVYVSEFPKFEKGKQYTINDVRFAAIKDFDYLEVVKGYSNEVGDVIDYLELTGHAVKLTTKHAKNYIVSDDVKVIIEKR